MKTSYEGFYPLRGVNIDAGGNVSSKLYFSFQGERNGVPHLKIGQELRKLDVGGKKGYYPLQG